MTDACKSAFDNAVTTVAGQFGYTGDGPIAMHENARSESEDCATVRIVASKGTGIEMNIPVGDTVQAAPDGGKGWLIVLAASVLVSFSTLQKALQPNTLALYGQKKGEIQTNTSGLSRQQTLELELDRLLGLLIQGDTTVQENVTILLHLLNKAHEAQDIIKRKVNKTITEATAETVKAKAVLDTVSTTQKTLFALFGVVSVTLILVIGYRLVALIGSVLIGVGCLGAAFCNTCNVHLVAFLYGAIPGMGFNMVAVSTTVPVLEYFKKRRLIALIIPMLGSLFTTLLIYVLLFFVLQSSDLKTWKNFLLIQAGAAGLMIPFSLVLKPLHLRMADETNSSFVSRVFGIDGLKIYKNPILYSFALMVFLWESGFAIITAKLPSFKGLDLIPVIKFGQILAILLSVASFFGTCIPCCFGKKLSLRTIIIMVSVFCITTGFFNFLVSQLYNFVYALVYAGILGFIKGIVLPIIFFALPLVVGEDNLAIGTGVVVMAQGLAGLVMTPTADEIEKTTQMVDGCFYLAAVLFMVCFVCTGFTYYLYQKANKVSNIKATANEPQ